MIMIMIAVMMTVLIFPPKWDFLETKGVVSPSIWCLRVIAWCTQNNGRYRDTHYWILAKRENYIFLISDLSAMTIFERFSLWTRIWPKDE